MRTAPGEAAPWAAAATVPHAVALRASARASWPGGLSGDSLRGAKEGNVLGPEPLLTSIQTWLS